MSCGRCFEYQYMAPEICHMRFGVRHKAGREGSLKGQPTSMLITQLWECVLAVWLKACPSLAFLVSSYVVILFLSGHKLSRDMNQIVCSPCNSPQNPELTSTLYHMGTHSLLMAQQTQFSKPRIIISMFNQIFLEFERGLILSFRWMPTYFFIPNSPVCLLETFHTQIHIYKGLSSANCPLAYHRSSCSGPFSKPLKTVHTKGWQFSLSPSLDKVMLLKYYRMQRTEFYSRFLSWSFPLTCID